ncbi:class I SAM-dependent methyltransferase [Endozoicomonas lisbonensis]|uniref:Ribosomal RNA small subunit methyltransferase C n=1 Tax=Endozoicomonas lisbonensis TaxID=3120522 RepID=A0ABV2SL33_9GAMM
MGFDSLVNTSQLVMRNAQWLESDNMLLVGMPADNLASVLLEEGVATRVSGLTRDYAVYRRIRSVWARNERLNLEFAPVVSKTEQRFDGVILFLQKSKPLMDYWLDMLLPLLTKDGCIWLVGENGEGIKSWRKRLKNTFESVKNLDNARHCGLLEGAAPVSIEAFDWQKAFTEFEIPVAGQRLSIQSLPGVFSHGRLDVGTQVLLDTFDMMPSGKVLDFGCGAGVISAYLAQVKDGNDYTLVDCDALALASSEHSLQQLGVERFKTVASDGLSDVEGSFDFIVSNPPFHQGVKTHYAVTEQFLAESPQRLNKGGELRIVANSFLRYEPIIVKAFGHCKTLVTRNGFSVYQAIKR